MNFEQNILNNDFYSNTLICLRLILGKVLVSRINNEITAGRIVEAEAYMGPLDKGAHTFNNRLTPRTKVIFGDKGHAYIYSVHMQNMLNVVTEEVGIPHAILIRAIEPIHGIEIMQLRRPNKKLIELGNGPGKLCSSMGITKELYGNDMTILEKLWITDDGTNFSDDQIVKTKRVGIKYAQEFIDVPWRYYIKGNIFVSKK